MLSDPSMRKYFAGWALFGVFLLALPHVATTGTLRIFIFANFIAIFA